MHINLVNYIKKSKQKMLVTYIDLCATKSFTDIEFTLSYKLQIEILERHMRFLARLYANKYFKLSYTKTQL